MSKSPGHQKHPEHRVAERHLDQRMTVSINGEVIADSRDVIRVDEDKSPTRFYFPRSDVKMDKLQSSDKTSVCPFKGTARYFSISAGGNHTCGVSDGNVLYCWGENVDGALGDGTQTNRSLPAKVAFQP